MNLLTKIIVICSFATIATTGFSQGKKGKSAGGSRKAPEKFISREAEARKVGDKKVIDFESTGIDGMRKTPLGSLIDNRKSNKEYDFIKIRQRWTPEMVQSASSLEAGSR